MIKLEGRGQTKVSYVRRNVEGYDTVAAFLDRFKRAPALPEITDAKQVEEKYAHWRVRVFYSMYIGYALYYLARRSLATAMPILVKDLGYTASDLGILTSVLALAYGASKFFSGILGDLANPRYFMAFGLAITGLCNILFGFSSSLILFVFLWGFNGWFQGFGSPACARLLTHWYSHSERGRWWSFWSTSQNVGAALVPLLAGFCAEHYGWRAAMVIPGVMVLFGALFLVNRLADTPRSLGLPSIEKFRDDYPNAEAREEKQKLSAKEILFEYVLNNKYIWILGVTYFFVYLIRQSISDWTVLYLTQTHGYTNLGAAKVVCWFEIGGVLGGLTAGWSSDKIFGANRGPVNAIFCLFIVLSLYAFWMAGGISPILDSICIFSMGFFVFGPQMLIGVAAAELSHKNASATATGLIGWIAYLGCATAGYPLGKVLTNYSWEVFFMILIGCAAISVLLLLPLWNVQAKKETIAA